MLVARDATRTRERLLRAGERRFARDGVAGARLRDVVRDAGQRNDSAVGYHFGSRAGLLQAIVDRHLSAMEVGREPTRPHLNEADLAGVVRMIVEPTAALLRSDPGRDFLRIVEQLAGYSGVRTGEPALVIRSTVLEAQLERLETLLRGRHGRPVSRERTAALVTFLTASLAERARLLDRGERPALAHRRYVDDLVGMLAAAVSA